MSIENTLQRIANGGRGEIQKSKEKWAHTVLHIPSKDEIKNDVIRVSKNYNEEYFFEDHEIMSITTHNQNHKGGYRLYDLTVEDDESFVVNGVISHNCRCKITYVAPNWGFNKDGKIQFKGLNWDEYSHQHNSEQFPPPIKKKKKKKK